MHFFIGTEYSAISIPPQQLQRLRDLGFLQFVRPGHYRLRR
ncbi:MAG: hypothetical protein ACRD4U_04220 [Candidatus Acidiferrales bacterium]